MMDANTLFVGSAVLVALGLYYNDNSAIGNGVALMWIGISVFMVGR